jgi:hypothetical protein
MLSASSRRRRDRARLPALRGIRIGVALGGLPGGSRGALRDRRKTAIDAAAVDGIDLDADGMARIIRLRRCGRRAEQARTRPAHDKQDRVHDAAHDQAPFAVRTRHNAAADGTKLPRSRRIAAKARCHDESGCRATQGDAHWPTR